MNQSGTRAHAVGNRESGIGNRESGTGCRVPGPVRWVGAMRPQPILTVRRRPNERRCHVSHRHAGAFRRLRCLHRALRIRAAVALSIGLLAGAGCGSSTPPPRTRPSGRAPAPSQPPAARPAPLGEMTLRIEVGQRGSGVVENVGLEAYVRDVVVGELSIAAADGALASAAYEAQAVVARTYALAGRRRHAAEGFDLCSSTHCQIYVRDQWRRSRWASAVDTAVNRTRGQYLESAGQPIEAVFHAHCGGHTSAAAEVWRSAGAPYLRGVDDPYCLKEQPDTWTSTLDLETLRVALNQRPRTEVGARLDGIQVLRRDAAGRVVEDRAVGITGADRDGRGLPIGRDRGGRSAEPPQRPVRRATGRRAPAIHRPRLGSWRGPLPDRPGWPAACRPDTDRGAAGLLPWRNHRGRGDLKSAGIRFNTPPGWDSPVLPPEPAIAAPRSASPIRDSRSASEDIAELGETLDLEDAGVVRYRAGRRARAPRCPSAARIRRRIRRHGPA